MAWNKYGILVGIFSLCLLLLTACKISYKFTGTSIDYNVIKTLQIDNIANRAPYGWAPMEAIFNNKLQDLYANQTRLEFVKRNGDLRIAGEITGYEQYNKAVSADGYSSQVQLKMTVNIRFENKKANVAWEKQFSATTQYDANQQLAAVQEELVTEMARDIAEQIFNATVADW
ncbi:MAG: LptE family protein [Bacteroidaceae bacterium]|jgi:outer membrane lipopolysaccharide assembly protein LptE/RlpB|nr:LptE family protein [Bacteroidaceae bacterium]